MRSRLTIILLGVATVALAVTTVLAFLTRPAAAAPTKPQPAHFPPVACEGYGATSFCHVTVGQDGTEYLFDEDRNGTIVLITQTPPK